MVNKKDLYSNPRYYDLAFCSFRDVKKEVDLIEECIHRYSRIPVKQVLEIACGPSPNLKEFVKRGYEYVGLDANQTIIDYACQKYSTLTANTTFIVTDLRDFLLKKPVDLIFIMGGSLMVKSTQDILSHFASVKNSLKPGGLYFLDSCVEFHFAKQEDSEWTIEENNMKFDVKISSNIIDNVNQLLKCTLMINGQDDERDFHLESADIFRIIFPQEFLLLLERNKSFEFIGWWNGDLKEPIQKAQKITRTFTLIRRI